MNNSQKHYVEQKNSDTKDFIQYDSIYMST